MSKTAEQKALEAYPIEYYRNGGGIDDANASDRAVYEEGYDQAFQDFMEKAEEWFEDTQLENFICRDDGIYFENERFIEQFKNYMKKEA